MAVYSRQRLPLLLWRCTMALPPVLSGPCCGTGVEDKAQSPSRKQSNYFSKHFHPGLKLFIQKELLLYPSLMAPSRADDSPPSWSPGRYPGAEPTAHNSLGFHYIPRVQYPKVETCCGDGGGNPNRGVPEDNAGGVRPHPTDLARRGAVQVGGVGLSWVLHGRALLFHAK